MRRFLLASAAAASLTLAFPALAQTPEPVPATPPVTTPEPEADVTEDERIGVTGQAAPTEGATAPDPAAPAASPAATPAPAPAPAPQLQASADTASSICAPRTTEVNLGARGAALNRDNSNMIERAVDAASVCDLQQVVIADSAEGALSTRRARTVRALLVRQGVPADLITVQQGAADEPGEVEVRMTFAGVARADAPTAAGAAAEPPAAPQAAPDPVPAEPDADVETDEDTPADT